MLSIKNKIIYNLFYNININVSIKNNLFFIKTLLGISFFFLPSFYFFKKNKNNFYFLFLKKFFFNSFISHFFYNYLNLHYLYIIRLKIKGLGYQIYRICNSIFSFHFNFINFFYLIIPYNIIFIWYKKKIIFLSNNLFLLKIIFKNILLLKKLGPYRLLGLRYPRQIIILKKGSKTNIK